MSRRKHAAAAPAATADAPEASPDTDAAASDQPDDAEADAEAATEGVTADDGPPPEPEPELPPDEPDAAVIADDGAVVAEGNIDAEPDPVADRMAMLDQLTREAEDMGLYDDPPAAQPADVPPAPQPINVVVFDARGNVILGAINEAQTGIDWTTSNAAVDGDDLAAAIASIVLPAGAAGFGVYNLVTGAVELFGRVGAAPPPVHREWWSALVPTLPKIPPLHPDPEAYRAQAVPQPIDAELAAAVDVTADAPTEAPPAAEPIEPPQHAAIASAHWGAMCARGRVSFDVAATAQGAAIAADAARERRRQFPASTPEASVAAVESLGDTLRNLRHLIACYRHLAHAAAGGVDVSAELALVDGVAAPLFPELG